MKNKNKSLFIVLIVFLTLGLNIKNLKADVGSVNWDAYYAWITNRNGATALDRDSNKEEFLPYGSRIYVWHGSNYERSYSPKDTYEINTETGFNAWFFSGKNFAKIVKEPDLNLVDKTEYRLYVSDDISSYEGPDTKFKKVGDYKKGNIIVSDYNDGMFAHIKDSTNNEWIYFRQTNYRNEMPKVFICPKENNEVFMCAQNITLYRNINAGDTFQAEVDIEYPINYEYFDYTGKKYVNVTTNQGDFWALIDNENSYEINNNVQEIEINESEEQMLDEKLVSVPIQILYAVLIGVVSCATAVVIIKLLNKVKK